MIMLLLDVFDRPQARSTLASRGSGVDTHYHIVTTFEAKESGVPGVLAQILAFTDGWSRRCVCAVHAEAYVV
jgi:hypothetical protein